MTSPKPDAADRDAVFSTRVAVTVSAVAAVSFITTLILMGHGDNARQSLTSGPGGFSMSAIGYCAAADFLRDSSIDVRMRRSRRSVTANSRTAVFLAEPDFDPIHSFDEIRPHSGDPFEGQSHFDRRENARALFHMAGDMDAPFVVVLPKWHGRTLRKPEGLWVHQADLLSLDSSAKPLELLTSNAIDASNLGRHTASTPREVACRTSSENFKAEFVSPQWLVPGEGVEPIVSTPDGALIARVNNGYVRPFFVISDPDLLNNHGLARADNAEILLRFLRDELKVNGVVFDEVSHGLQQETPFLAEFVRVPLAYVSLHGLAVFALILWAAAATFGKVLPLAPRITAGKTSLIENTAQLLSHRGRFLQSAGRYFDDVISEVARTYHLPHKPSSELVDDLQRLTNQRRLEVDLPDLQRTLKPPQRRLRSSYSQLLEAARSLHRWREGMLNGR
jgi:hypothetical protein